MQELNDCQSLQQQLAPAAAALLPNMPPTPTTSTPTSSTSRHYVDKARLIQLVHDNPILWDCRLPNYKRADKSKTEQWNHLGVIFNVSGERVQRTFTSLREIFRRELNNEKLLGRRFKSKWEFYKSMSFLRDVIRERKPRERHAKAKRRSQLSPNLNNTLSSSNVIDEYQYFAPNDPNNPSIKQQQQQPVNNHEEQKSTNNDTLSSLAQQNSSQISVLNLLTQLSNGGGVVVASGNQKSTTPNQHQQQHQQQINIDDDDVDLVQASPATSTAPSMYIKDEIEIPDDDEDDVDEEDSTSITFNGEVLYTNNNKIKIQDTNQSTIDEHRPRSKRNFKNQLQHWKRNHKSYLEDIDDVDEDDGSSVESVPTKHIINNTTNKNDDVNAQLDLANINEQMSSVSGVNGVGGTSGTTAMAAFDARSGESEIKYRRHLVYTKFADFIVAKMDAMSEREADDLMDRMMLVIAQKH